MNVTKLKNDWMDAMLTKVNGIFGNRVISVLLVHDFIKILRFSLHTNITMNGNHEATAITDEKEAVISSSITGTPIANDNADDKNKSPDEAEAEPGANDNREAEEKKTDDGEDSEAEEPIEKETMQDQKEEPIEQEAKNAEPHHNNENQSPQRLNKFAIFVAIVAILYYLWPRDPRPHVCGNLTLRCPNDATDSVFYVPIPQNHYSISAEQERSDCNIKYKWELVQHSKMENKPRIAWASKTQSVLQIDKIWESGEYALKLQIEAETERNRVKETTCNVKVKFVEIPRFSIDLGTTFSCIAYRDNKSKAKPVIIVIAIEEEEHERYEYCIPTAIYFPRDKGEAVKVGYTALDYLSSDPHNVIYDIKRIVGRKRDEAEVVNFIKNHKFIALTDDEYPNITIPNRGIEIRPEQALSVILAHLVEKASKEFEDGAYSPNVVVSVPAFFHNGPRKAIRSACELVGLSAQRLVVEPSAAALAYIDEDPTLKHKNLRPFMIFDFGGGTLDCSIVRCHGYDCRVQAVNGDPALGGIDFDNVIKEMIMKKVRKKLPKGVTIKEEEEGAIQREAEVFKKILSDSSVAKRPISIDGKPYEVQIQRAKFWKKVEAEGIMRRAISVAKSAIDKAIEYGRTDKIDFIVMVGGTSKIPLVQNEIKKHFGTKDLKILHPTRDEQELVVAGGAIVADRLDCRNTKTNCPAMGIVDVIPLSFGFAQCMGDRGASVNPVVDLVYVIDFTGSMSDWMKQVKLDVTTLTASLQKQFKNIQFRIGGIGYRDWADEKARIARFPFGSTKNYAKWLDKQRATGGSDYPEDVLGGLYEATKLKWSSSQLRLVIHILDAPPHGKIFTSAEHDSHPNGHKNDPIKPPDKYYKTVLDTFKKKDIGLMVVKLESGVDKMARLFGSYASKIGLDIQIKTLDHIQDLKQLLPTSESWMSDQITSHITPAPTSESGGTYSEDSKAYSGTYECGVMDVVVPKNEKYPVTKRKKYCTHHPDAVEAEFELFEGDEHYVKNNYFLSNIVVRNVPKGSCKTSMIDVEFNINSDGILTVNATLNDATNNKQKTYVLTVETRDGSLNAEQIIGYRNMMIDWFSSDSIKASLRNAKVNQPHDN
eukprot:877345_1